MPGSQGSGNEDNGWGDPTTLTRHYNDHGAAVGATSEEDYARKAQELLQQALRGKLPTKVDVAGVTRVYDPINKLFGAYNADGTTRTFFRMSNIRYWNNQPGTLIGGP